MPRYDNEDEIAPGLVPAEGVGGAAADDTAVY
jgi:hypothetical protein